jgi:putative DNA primase/helicase
MESLIAKAIPALREVLAEQEFVKCDKVTQNLEEFEKSNNPILEFFDDIDDRDYLNEPIKAVYQKYSSFCLANNLNPISAIEFQKQIKKQYDLVIKTVEHHGRKVRIYSNE